MHAIEVTFSCMVTVALKQTDLGKKMEEKNLWIPWPQHRISKDLPPVSEIARSVDVDNLETTFSTLGPKYMKKTQKGEASPGPSVVLHSLCVCVRVWERETEKDSEYMWEWMCVCVCSSSCVWFQLQHFALSFTQHFFLSGPFTFIIFQILSLLFNRFWQGQPVQLMGH